MQTIDHSTWLRQDHYNFFKGFDYPHFSVCAQVDVSNLVPHVKQRNHSLNLTLAYLLAHTANRQVDFRYRIRDEEVVAHDLVHPSFTIMAENDLFSFCTVNYSSDFTAFTAEGSRQIALAEEAPSLKDQPGRDDLLFMTAIPWISFTSFTHPIHLHPVDSIPRFAWGKIYQEGSVMKMPLSIQVHHALMDGLHVGQYFALFQEYLDKVEEIII